MNVDSSPLPISEPSFFILLSLAAGPRHGYAVLKDAEELSSGKISLSVSTLYSALGRLQEQGMIEREETPDEERRPGLPRKFYRLTRQGKDAIDAEALRLKALLSAYGQRLGTESR
jgi:DNA-binding PadR family transcriptional regulator